MFKLNIFFMFLYKHFFIISADWDIQHDLGNYLNTFILLLFQSIQIQNCATKHQMKYSYS